uniref:Pdgfa associated protein 1a n=1 Tax=Poecilia reticulata TaxID=8081 RepID=A0A3P9PUD0_POERE
KKGHKGRGKQFSNPEEIDRQMRLQREKEESGGAEKESSESEEESSSEDKRSGVEGLIEIENPNRVSQKSKKVTEVDVSAPRELSRREEEIEKQKSAERYRKLHLEGKTEQARADLARLAIIKKQREEAARKR